MTQSQRTLNPKTVLSSVATAAAMVLVLSGCAGNIPGNFGTAGTPVTAAVHMTGTVHGGQQPVVGATIQLYAVGTSGPAAMATALIASPPQTMAGGQFNITGSYSCSGYTDVYIVATGGYPSGSSSVGSANPNLSLVAALGDCATLQRNAATTNINMNEVTTAAAAYALAPFAADLTHVGAYFASATVVPTGLALAFQNAALLADTSQGASPGVGLAAGVSVPSTEINTIANILASCLNSTGAGSSTCTPLFGATGASDIFGAALAMAKNPGSPAITGLYSLSSGTAPFQPSQMLTSAPKDFSVAVTYAGPAGTLSTPYGIAIDATGNAWVTNESGTTVTEFSPTGSVLAAPTASGLVGAQGLGFDELGNLWVANTAGNSAVRFTLTSGAVSATSVFTDPSLAGPTGVAFDNNGSAFLPNFNGNSVTVLSTSNGAANASSPITGSGLTVPSGIAADTSGRIYVTTGNGSVLQVQAGNAAPVATLTDNTLQGPVSVGLMGSQVFVSGFTTGSAVAGAVGEYTAQGAVAGSPFAFGSLTSPAGIATDNVSAWIANSIASGGLFQISAGSASVKSPAAGFGALNLPISVALDPAGSVWVTNSGSNTISVFIGLAQPVMTPYVKNES